jgi:F-type H+-transporting ATPase subunit b
VFFLPAEGFGFNFDIIETNILNLTVVIGVVVYLGGDVLRSLLSERKQKIIGTLQNATERFLEAEQKREEAKEKVQRAQAKALEIREQGRKAALQSQTILIARTAEEILRLEEGKETNLRFEEEKVTLQLRQHVVRLSLAKALVQLQTKIDFNLQRRLIDSNIDILGKL